jgi:hypothetical protein
LAEFKKQDLTPCRVPESEKNPEPSDRDRIRAQHAWQLLNSWRRPPGVQADRSINGDALRQWIRNARDGAAKMNRSEIADEEIGKILFHLPRHPSNPLLPAVELRQLFEELQSKDIEHGFLLEQFNSRGVVQKAVFEGGVQELALAEKWRKAAESIESRYPRIKSLYNKIASSWDEEAKAEDQRAEQRRLRRG